MGVTILIEGTTEHRKSRLQSHAECKGLTVLTDRPKPVPVVAAVTSQASAAPVSAIDAAAEAARVEAIEKQQQEAAKAAETPAPPIVPSLRIYAGAEAAPKGTHVWVRESMGITAWEDVKWAQAHWTPGVEMTVIHDIPSHPQVPLCNVVVTGENNWKIVFEDRDVYDLIVDLAASKAPAQESL